ncbi:CRISPR-associated Cas4 family exonuclease [Arcticibacter pallidicorallinus]|uniref:CRISPR-associated exonuclease Cas4 n=1 Tax=Arcticibacter pallidicorallinus TaxID=1259464 RepID=A0A2T0TT45_9SPHI|nr:CRISPR-associated protein Cas4 [Arcticibacter pallidicorallinus]PRY48839.1 CRISPR-associated Cas4 family exonuclease [Arcticibacter pallidicorallinus]
MQINATLINLYHVCKRELWLHANGIRMEHTSETVAEGKLIGETSYASRSEKYTEVEIDGIKIDFYDARNKVVHEVKKSNKVEKAHIAQVKYYIYKLLRNGVEGVSGVIEYPKMRQTERVCLSPADILEIEDWERSIDQIVKSENCPPLLDRPICKTCSYYDFCYINDDA